MEILEILKLKRFVEEVGTLQTRAFSCKNILQYIQHVCMYILTIEFGIVRHVALQEDGTFSAKLAVQILHSLFSKGLPDIDHDYHLRYMYI